MHGALGNVELCREAATLVMIATLGVLAGRTWRRRAGYAALAFGVWDIFYYVFLRLISGWPRTLLDWDILFLLPLPWWGPVLAPVSIALVMILWGTLATQSRDDATDARWARALACVGIVLALAVFMIDAWRALPDGRDAVLRVLPDDFNWPLFWVALLLMATPWRTPAGVRALPDCVVGAPRAIHASMTARSTRPRISAVRRRTRIQGGNEPWIIFERREERIVDVDLRLEEADVDGAFEGVPVRPRDRPSSA